MNIEKINSDLIKLLKKIYSKHFDTEYIGENMAIPKVYNDSIDKLKIEEIFSQSSALSNTKWGIDVYGDDFLERRKANKLTKYDVIFLSIGEWGSNHQFLMCCDKSSDDFGKVFDYNDAHPWCESNNWEVEWEDFRTFIKDEYDIINNT